MRKARASSNRSRASPRAEPDLSSRPSSHFENLGIALFDHIGVALDAFDILFHQLDVGELADAGLLHLLLVRRILPGKVHHDLLAFPRMHPVLEQARGIRAR